VLLAVLDRIGEPTRITTGAGVVPRGFAFLLGFTLGGMLLQSLKPSIGSVFSSMLLGMLCLVPVLVGTGILIFGWQLAALFLLVLAAPLGAALGFIDWNNLYRHARPKRIPLSKREDR
jgi:hypothetical protein